MIQQPELGKKIADLRKAKGLTQEELVEKCNLNVRTLQRIESGEVMPRTYTIRLIFEALEVPFDKSINDKGLILKWLEQFYISFIDLFNLKTNTMKKISILSVIMIAVASGLWLLNTTSNAQNKVENKNTKIRTEPSNHFIDEGRILNLTCDGMWTENNEIIGRDVEFNYEGVKVSFKIVILNKQNMEFRSTIMKGNILPDKVNVSVPKKAIEAHMLNYSAENIEKNGDNIFLKGNAKLISSQNDIIETDEIIISMVTALYN